MSSSKFTSNATTPHRVRADIPKIPNLTHYSTLTAQILIDSFVITVVENKIMQVTEHYASMVCLVVLYYVILYCVCYNCFLSVCGVKRQ